MWSTKLVCENLAQSGSKIKDLLRGRKTDEEKKSTAPDMAVTCYNKNPFN